MALSPAQSFLPGFRLQDGTDLNTQLVDKLNSIIEGNPATITVENVVFDVNTAVTAKAGGTQAAATQLTGNVGVITVCATDADSVQLPAGQKGAVYALWNSGAKSAQVFGNGTDTINGVATATGVALASGAKALHFCTSDQPAASWFRVLSA
jgi:hypothetical protein